MKWQDVIEFWFDDLEPSDWFKKSLELDQKIQDRFLGYYKAAYRGELFAWREEAEGRLAEIIVLDQFSRNIFRDRPEAFRADPLALALSQEAVKDPACAELEARKKAFLYMPYMHSESLLIHEEAVKLFSEPGLEMNLEFEHKHKVIIERFGRYPHRNKVLGRESTPEEIEFLKGPNSSF